uniref:Uncharacterized protein n=1 Tax=Aegilops tauschii subsp. strangulata TaxID=200361 RepID=A0A453IVK7_AEGTS
GDILLERTNSSVMLRYVSSKENLIVLMNLLRDPSQPIQVEAFHIFKVQCQVPIFFHLPIFFNLHVYIKLNMFFFWVCV